MPPEWVSTRRGILGIASAYHYAGCCILFQGKFTRDGYRRYRFHGLDWQRDAKGDARQYVGSSCEEQRGGQGDGVGDDEGRHEGQEGAQVAQRARELSKRGGDEGIDIVPVGLSKTGPGQHGDNEGAES